MINPLLVPDEIGKRVQGVAVELVGGIGLLGLMVVKESLE